MILVLGLGAIAASAAFSTMLKAPTPHMAIAYLTFSAVAYALSTTVLAFALRRPSTSAKSASDTHGVSSMGSTCSDRTFEKSPRQIRREPSQIDFHPAVQNRPVTSTNGMFVLIQCAVLPTIGAIALLLMLGYAHVDGGGDWHTVGVNVIFAAQAHAMVRRYSCFAAQGGLHVLIHFSMLTGYCTARDDSRAGPIGRTTTCRSMRPRARPPSYAQTARALSSCAGDYIRL